MRRTKKMNRKKVTQSEAHLCEFMWRWWDMRPKPEAILSFIKVYYCLSGPTQFSASHPLFSTWNRRPTDARNDTLSRYDSSTDNKSDTDVVPQQQRTATSSELPQQESDTAAAITTNQPCCSQSVAVSVHQKSSTVKISCLFIGKF